MDTRRRFSKKQRSNLRKRTKKIVKEEINLKVFNTAHSHTKKVAKIEKLIKRIKSKELLYVQAI